jgi:hypothetical protein
MRGVESHASGYCDARHVTEGVEEKKAPPAHNGDGGARTSGTKRVFEALSNL